jgi:lipopolysaccharide/colanic/teichoic acid biosynthesis glycosyltransferase
MLLAWIAIRLTSRGAGFFVSTRIGKDGKPFQFLKFRTMYSPPINGLIEQKAYELAAEGILLKMEDDPRVSPVGKFLRRTSIDELPQLFNVLAGNMSIVGPRPLIGFMIESDKPENKKRLSVLPGITGYWQIYAREKNNSLQDMLYYDLRYIDEISLTTDMKIILRTIKAVSSGRGAF